jgi:hypothetical protein
MLREAISHYLLAHSGQERHGVVSAIAPNEDLTDLQEYVTLKDDARDNRISTARPSSNLSAITVLRKRAHLQPINLAQLMHVLYLSSPDNRSQAKEAKDLVFALLSMVSDKFDLDYNATVEALYMDIAYRFFFGGYMEILTIPRSKASKLKLPSWAFDWTQTQDRSNVQNLHWKSMQTNWKDRYPFVSPEVRLLKDTTSPHGMLLLLGGKRIGSITALGDGWKTLVREGGSDEDERRAKIESWIEALKDVNLDLNFNNDVLPHFQCGEGEMTKWLSWICWVSAIKAFLRQHLPADASELPLLLELLLLGGQTSLVNAGNYRDICEKITRWEHLFRHDKGMERHPGARNLIYLEYGLDFGSDMRPARLSSGHFCLLPHDAIAGDIVVLFLSMGVPLILREVSIKYCEMVYTIIGPAYVCGIMDRSFPGLDSSYEMFKLV